LSNSSEKPAFFRVLSEKATDTPVSECDITFVLTGEWNGGCTGEIVVLNNTQQTIYGWSLEFVCDGTVNNVWNGKVTRKEGNRYSVSDDGSYTVILPGGSARIGVNLSGGGTDFYPKEFLLQVQ